MFFHLNNIHFLSPRQERLGIIKSPSPSHQRNFSQTKNNFLRKERLNEVSSTNKNTINQNSCSDFQINPLFIPIVSPNEHNKENNKINFKTLFKISCQNKYPTSKGLNLLNVDINPLQEIKQKGKERHFMQENFSTPFSPSISVISYKLQPINSLSLKKQNNNSTISITSKNLLSDNNNTAKSKENNTVVDVSKTIDMDKAKKEKPKNITLLSIQENLNKSLEPVEIVSPKGSNRVATPPNFYTNEYQYYAIYPENCGYMIKKCLEHRKNWKECHSLSTNRFNFKWKDCSVGINYGILGIGDNKQIVNHFQFHSSISNKAKLFKNLFKYCESINKEVFQYIPFTLVIDLNDQPVYTSIFDGFKSIFDNIGNFLFDYPSIRDKSFSRRKVSYSSIFPNKDPKLGLKTNILIPNTHYQGKNYWIIKAPNLNRGRCIKLVNSLAKIQKFIKLISVGECSMYSDDKSKKLNESSSSKYQSSIILIQKYIERPLLYNKRKFDIRVWVLLTHKFDVYVFKEGHMKACSVNYDINNIENCFIHLTNYSLQKYNENFSKFEKGNEISFDTFQHYLDTTFTDRHISIRNDIFPKMKEIIELTMRSVKNIINENNKQFCFEIFGYDFMMDEDFNVFLIEINTNPGLEESSELIKMLVPRMVDDALRLTIDDIFPPTLSDEWKENEQYKSNLKVTGYSDSDNLWELICNLNENYDKKERTQAEKVNIKKLLKEIRSRNRIKKKRKMHLNEEEEL